MSYGRSPAAAAVPSSSPAWAVARLDDLRLDAFRQCQSEKAVEAVRRKASFGMLDSKAETAHKHKLYKLYDAIYDTIWLRYVFISQSTFPDAATPPHGSLLLLSAIALEVRAGTLDLLAMLRRIKVATKGPDGGSAAAALAASVNASQLNLKSLAGLGVAQSRLTELIDEVKMKIMQSAEGTHAQSSESKAALRRQMAAGSVQGGVCLHALVETPILLLDERLKHFPSLDRESLYACSPALRDLRQGLVGLYQLRCDDAMVSLALADILGDAYVRVIQSPQLHDDFAGALQASFLAARACAWVLLRDAHGLDLAATARAGMVVSKSSSQGASFGSPTQASPAPAVPKAGDGASSGTVPPPTAALAAATPSPDTTPTSPAPAPFVSPVPVPSPAPSSSLSPAASSIASSPSPPPKLSSLRFDPSSPPPLLSKAHNAQASTPVNPNANRPLPPIPGTPSQSPPQAAVPQISVAEPIPTVSTGASAPPPPLLSSMMLKSDAAAAQSSPTSEFVFVAKPDQEQEQEHETEAGKGKESEHTKYTEPSAIVAAAAADALATSASQRGSSLTSNNAAAGAGAVLAVAATADVAASAVSPSSTASASTATTSDSSPSPSASVSPATAAAACVTEQPSPAAAAAMAADEWTQHTHNGSTYYYNARTQTSSWTRPAATEAFASKLPSLSTGSSSSVSGVGEEVLIDAPVAVSPLVSSFAPAATPKLCAVDGCNTARFSGRPYCVAHIGAQGAQ